MSTAQSPLNSLMYPDQWHDPHGDRLAAIISVKGEEDGAVIHRTPRGVATVTCDGGGILWEISEEMGRGFYEIVRVAPGLLLTVYQMFLNKPLKNRVRQAPHYTLGIWAKGAGEFKRSLVFPDDNSGFVLWGAVSENYARETVLPANKLIMAASFSMSLGEDLNKLGLHSRQLTGALVDSRGELDEMAVFVSHMRPSAESLRCLSELFGVAYQGALRHDYFCIKARELMCHIDFLSSRSEQKEKRSVRARYSDVAALEKARKILAKGYSGKLNLDDIARDTGLPPNRLNALFKQRFGLTIHAYLLGLRMEKAQNLLKNTDLPVEDISMRVGYSNASGFRQAFRKYYGVSPKVVRYQ